MATTFSWLKVRPLQNKVRFSSSLKVTCQILLGALFLIWIENWFTVECYKFRVKPPSAAASTGLIGALDCRSTKLWFDDGQHCEPTRPACWLGIFWLESFRGLTCIVLASHTLLSARQLCLQLCGSFDEVEGWTKKKLQLTLQSRMPRERPTVHIEGDPRFGLHVLLWDCWHFHNLVCYNRVRTLAYFQWDDRRSLLEVDSVLSASD